MLVYQRVSPLVNFSIDPSSHRADALITSQVQNRQDTRRRRRARLPQALRARFHLAQRPRALLLLFLRIGFSSCAVGQPVLLFGHGWDDCGGNQCCTIGSRKLMEMVKWGMFQNARYLSLSNSPTIACNTYISPDQETSKEKTSLDPPDLKSLLAKKKPTSLSQGLQRSPTRIISFLNLGFQRFHTNTLTICVLKIRYSKKLKTQTPIAPIAFTACRTTTSAPPSCAALRSTASRRSMFCSGVAKLVNGNAKEPENPKCPAVRMPFGRVYSWRMDIFGGPTNCGTGGGQLTVENLLLLEGSSMKCIVNNGHFHSVCQCCCHHHSKPPQSLSPAASHQLAPGRARAWHSKSSAPS